MDWGSWLLIISVIVLAGAIAYLGDILGRRIGKRKLSLFKLRPRYTAILVSVITGILIAAVTLLILSAASQDVRTALFGMRELKDQITQLEEREKELQNSKIMLEEQVKTLTGSVEELNNQRQSLQEEIKALQVEQTRLRESILAIRQGEITFQDEEEILRMIAPPGMGDKEAEDYLLSIIERGEEIALERGAGLDEEIQRAVFVLEDSFNEAKEKLKTTEVPLVIRLVASVNTLRGEPVIARFLVDENKKIFSAGEVIWSEELNIEPQKTNIELWLGELLKELNTLAVKKGILPQQGRVGVISASNLTEVTSFLQKMEGKVTVEVIAEGDIFTAGPLRVYLQVKK
ncbi:MAG: hypothetical protein PWP57_674 [Candidatus Atribacteria bacterium]|jgi:uncharacterized protein (DUF3084 family)|nr:hypothetical protein [Candidatus Atribacteria bacterium]